MSRILLLLDTAGTGGAETVFLELADGLGRLGHTVVPLLHEEGWVSRSLRERGLEPIFYEAGGPFDIRYLGRLIGIIRAQRIDIVHAHLLTSIVYGSVAAFLCGVPAVGTIHGLPDLGRRSRGLSVKCWLINRMAAAIVFVSESLRAEVLARTKLRPRRAEVIYNGIDVDAYARAADGVGQSVRDEFAVGEDERLIVSVGNIRPAKSYDVLLRTARGVLDSGIKARFVVVGDPREPLFGELLALRRELGLEQAVTFVGFREDVARILRAADAFVLTSSTEGFSLATIQAMAAGAPIVATRSGGPEEILVHRLTGLLVATGSPAETAAALVEIILDPAVAKSLKREASTVVRERFTVDAMLGAHVRLFAELERT
jgi:glycosyltransferase involved in cell wall biosynthesis